VPAELICKINQCGFGDREERTKNVVLLAQSASNATLHDPVDCTIRHQALICCITAAGDPYCPLLASSDSHVTDIFDRRVRDLIDLTIEIASSPDVTEAIVESYVDHILIVAVVANRNLNECQDKRSILFSANCSAHCQEATVGKLARRHGILVSTHRAHPSNLFQVVDVLLCGIVKRVKTCQKGDETVRK
jgi:hypothetical protein